MFCRQKLVREISSRDENYRGTWRVNQMMLKKCSQKTIFHTINFFLLFCKKSLHICVWWTWLRNIEPLFLLIAHRQMKKNEAKEKNECSSLMSCSENCVFNTILSCAAHNTLINYINLELNKTIILKI